MPNVTTSDALNEERIRRVVEQQQEENLLWNELFRTINMPDYPTDTLKVPKEMDEMGMPGRVHEGSEFPRDEEEVETVPMTVKKYGGEVAVSWESEMFSVFDIVAQQVEKRSRKMSELINEKAFDEVMANLHPNSPISGSGFDYASIIDAREEILNEKYNPQILIVNTRGESALLKSNEFQRASDLGDETTLSGSIGRIAGLDVVVDNSGLLGTDTARGVIADPDEYGYELVKEDVATEEYEDQSRQARIFQIYTMRTWKAINEEAAIEITE